jgi:hypothetical protein
VIIGTPLNHDVWQFLWSFPEQRPSNAVCLKSTHYRLNGHHGTPRRRRGPLAIAPRAISTFSGDDPRVPLAATPCPGSKSASSCPSEVRAAELWTVFARPVWWFLMAMAARKFLSSNFFASFCFCFSLAISSSICSRARGISFEFACVC